MRWYATDVQWKRVLCDNAIGSHEWPDNRTIGRAPMQLAERRSFVHALHCTNARASQMGYLYMYRPFPSLFSRNGWIQQKILPLKKTKATTKIKVNCSLKQICLIYKAYCIRKIFAPVLISLFSLFLLVSGLRFGEFQCQSSYLSFTTKLLGRIQNEPSSVEAKMSQGENNSVYSVYLWQSIETDKSCCSKTLQNYMRHVKQQPHNRTTDA